MIGFRCKTCGSPLTEKKGDYFVCKYCEALWLDESAPTKLGAQLQNAWQALRDADFDRAEELFDETIAADNRNHEAYWGRALAAASIIYVDDLSENKKVPTCNNISEQSFAESSFVKKAIRFAPSDVAVAYKKQAEYIDSVRIEWLQKAAKEPPYDVFISYKDSAKEHGIERTADSIDAQELYTELVRRGYNVFYSRVSLRDKVAEHYEPYIYNALKTAKVMVVLAEKSEYITSTWVKNEWSRFRNRIESGEKDARSLVLVYKKLDLADVPAALRSRQCLNMDEMTFLSSLVKHVEKVLASAKNKKGMSKLSDNDKRISVRKIGQGAELSLDDKQTYELVKTYIANRRFDLARELLDGLLAANPKSGDFLLSKLVIEKQLLDEQSLFKSFGDLSDEDCAVLENAIMYSQRDTAESIIDRLYQLAKNEPSDEACKKIYKFVAPFDASIRDSKIADAFNDCIKKDKYNSFLLLLDALGKDDAEKYIEYTLQYIKTNGAKNDECYDMSERLLYTTEFNQYLARLSQKKKDNVLALLNKQKSVHEAELDKQRKKENDAKQKLDRKRRADEKRAAATNAKQLKQEQRKEQRLDRRQRAKARRRSVVYGIESAFESVRDWIISALPTISTVAFVSGQLLLWISFFLSESGYALGLSELLGLFAADKAKIYVVAILICSTAIGACVSVAWRALIDDSNHPMLVALVFIVPMLAAPTLASVVLLVVCTIAAAVKNDDLSPSLVWSYLFAALISVFVVIETLPLWLVAIIILVEFVLASRLLRRNRDSGDTKKQRRLVRVSCMAALAVMIIMANRATELMPQLQALAEYSAELFEETQHKVEVHSIIYLVISALIMWFYSKKVLSRDCGTIAFFIPLVSVAAYMAFFLLNEFDISLFLTNENFEIADYTASRIFSEGFIACAANIALHWLSVKIIDA